MAMALSIVYIFNLRYVLAMGKIGHRHVLRSTLIAVLLLFASSSVALSAELVMFRQALCEWCEVWDDEVGIVYNKTQEGKRVPIRQVDIHDKRPSDLGAIKPVIYTPTFVLVKGGVELGRIQGYPGEDFFWGLLSKMLKEKLAGS